MAIDLREKNPTKEKNLKDSQKDSKEKQQAEEAEQPLFLKDMKKYLVSSQSVNKEYRIRCLEEAIALFEEASVQADTLAACTDDVSHVASVTNNPDTIPAQNIMSAEQIAELLAQEGMEERTALEMTRRCRRDMELAKEQDLESRYQAATFWMKTAKTEDRWRHVTEVFESLGDYKDARELAKTSRQEMDHKASRNKVTRRSILGTVLVLIAAGLIFYYGGFYQYAKGYAYMKSRKYELAGTTFRLSPGFLKSDEFADYCTAKLLLSEPEGNPMTFGNHTWMILRRSKGIVTLIASDLTEEDPLLDMPFSDESGEVTWAESSLRAWLNGEFLDEVFSEKEKALLVKTDSIPSVNIRYGSEYTERTEDYVSILSGREALKSRYVSTLKKMNYSFWLRTPGNSMDAAAYMDAGGSVRWYGNPAHEDGLSVLPIVRVDTRLLPKYEE